MKLEWNIAMKNDILPSNIKSFFVKKIKVKSHKLVKGRILFKCMLDLRFRVQFPREIYRPVYAARY